MDEYTKVARMIILLGWIFLMLAGCISLAFIIPGIEELDEAAMYTACVSVTCTILTGLFLIYIGSVLDQSAPIWIKVSSYLIAILAISLYPIGLIFGVPILIYLLKARMKKLIPEVPPKI